MQDLLKQVMDSLTGLSPGARYLLGIVGPPGSGKTTLAELLVAQVNATVGKEVAIEAPMDGFHFQDEQLRQMGIHHLKGIPDSFDAAGFVSSVSQVRVVPQQVVAWPSFDRASERSVPGAITIGLRHRLVIVSGNYLLLDTSPWNQVASLLDEAWFVDADEATIHPRLVARHRAGGKNEADALAKVDGTDMPNARLVLGSKHRASRLVTFDLPVQA